MSFMPKLLPAAASNGQRISIRCVVVGIAASFVALTAGPLEAQTTPRFTAAKSPAGISFYWRRDETTPFAAVNFGMRDIYALTTPGKEGLMALGGALVMQGPEGTGPNEFIERLKDLTAGASVSIGPFTTMGSVRAPPATLSPAMALLAGALKNAAPSAKVLARLQQRSEGSEAQAVTRAETIAERTAMRLALGDHPITRAQDAGRFSRIAIEDVARWRSLNLDRTRLRIAASGRIDQAEAGRLIDDAFAGLPTGLPPQTFVWPPIEVPAATVVIEQETAQSAVLLIGLTSIDGGREVEIGNVANAILGAGADGRLWQAVRAGLGATYGAGSGFQVVAPSRRLVTMRAAIANDQVKASIETLKTAYATWLDRGVTAAELTATTSRFTSDFRSAMDDPSRANGVVISLLLSNRAVDDIYTYEDRLKAMGQDSVNQFITAKFPRPDRLLTVVVTPKAEGLGATCVIKTFAEIETCKLK